MQFLKCVLCVLPFFFVTAIASVEGLLVVEKPFSYQKGNKTLTVPAGTYKTDLKNRTSSLTLKFKDQAGTKQKVKMTVPRGSVPSRNGSFYYQSAQIEQPFDLSGQISTQEERTPTQSNYEACTYQRQVQVCTIDSTGRRICRLEYQTVTGTHQVMFHYVIERSSVNVSLQTVEDRSIFGNFSGTQAVQYVVNEFSGPCY